MSEEYRFDWSEIIDFDSEKFKELDKLAEERKKFINKYIKDTLTLQYKEIEKLFKESLKYIFPPIKGEITKGKLRWRGINLCEKAWNCLSEGVEREVWFTQRGIQISNILRFLKPKIIY